MNKKVIIAGLFIIIAVVVVLVISNRAQPTNSASNGATQNETSTEPGVSAPSQPKTSGTTVKPSSGTITNTNPGNVTPDMPRAQLSYTDSGFTSIAVKKGQTVRFMNQSNRGMQVISDSSTLNFGQTKPLLRGEYFDFVFYYPGTWKFHDALDPLKTGIVKVGN